MLLWDVRRVPHPARAGIPIGEAMAAFSGIFFHMMHSTLSDISSR